jgi:hypothetical protein
MQRAKELKENKDSTLPHLKVEHIKELFTH